MSNTITIELCAEDRARLEHLCAALDHVAELLTPAGTPPKKEYTPPMLTEMRRWGSVEEMAEFAKAAYEASAEAAQDAATEPVAEAPENNTPAEEEAPTAAPAPSEEAVEPAPIPSIEELRAIVQELAAPGSSKRAAVRTLVKSYADSVSNIPEDKRIEAMQKLIELKEAEA